MVNSCIFIYFHIYKVFSFLWNCNYFTIIMLYIIMDAICLQGIDGSRARVVFIQIAKCADRRARTMGHVGSEYVFCLECSHCCVYFSVLELLQPVTPGNPLSRPRLAGLGCIRVTPARRTNDAGLTILLINADMQFPRIIYMINGTFLYTFTY